MLHTKRSRRSKARRNREEQELAIRAAFMESLQTHDQTSINIPLKGLCQVMEEDDSDSDVPEVYGQQSFQNTLHESEDESSEASDQHVEPAQTSATTSSSSHFTKPETLPQFLVSLVSLTSWINKLLKERRYEETKF